MIDCLLGCEQGGRALEELPNRSSLRQGLIGGGSPARYSTCFGKMAPLLSMPDEGELHMQGRLASGKDIFGPLIRRYLLENRHRVSVEMLPDADLAAQREAAERDRLAAARSAMGPEDIQAVIQETKELKERQVSGPSLCSHPMTLGSGHWGHASACSCGPHTGLEQKS